MKFIAKDGSIHNSYFRAATNELNKKIHKTLDEKLPGYKQARTMEVIDDNEEDDFLDDIDYYMDTETESSEEGEPLPLVDVAEDGNTVAFEEEVPSSTNSTEKEHESSKPLNTHIEIDYMRGKLYLVDDDTGVHITESDIESKLLSSVTEAQVSKVLYPEGSIPEGLNTSSVIINDGVTTLKRDNGTQSIYTPITINNDGLSTNTHPDNVDITVTNNLSGNK